ncbi:MAG: WYL domain-containing protein [Corynebacterium sp.]|uniref:helix-turn-helix transcriptional regulator n=1 Tax=Corynebacterium sp. TaxID=1720 RepID=UPI0026DD0BE0|nr:WYL domain-containing protein [Corynebacterium sp.]MDO4762725.1 WYL domain-containing protein [Corynebacterium sp.]
MTSTSFPDKPTPQPAAHNERSAPLASPGVDSSRGRGAMPRKDRRDQQLERVTNLTFALLNAANQGREYVSREEIIHQVPGYLLDDAGQPRNQAAINVLFSRDCASLIALGVPLESFKVDGATVWRIQRGEYELPEISFTPAEATVLALAGKMDTSSPLATFSRSGWTKLAARGLDNALSPSPLYTPINDLNVLSAQVVDAIHVAVRTKQRLRFFYRRNPASDFSERWIDPWGLVTLNERVYLVGFDLDRGQARCFRVTKLADIDILDADAYDMSGYGEFQPAPDDVAVTELVRAQIAGGASQTTVRIKIQAGHGEQLRSRGRVLTINECVAAGLPDVSDDPDSHVYELVDVDTDWLVRQAAVLAPYVTVLDPPPVVDEVISLLKTAAGIPPHDGS